MAPSSRQPFAYADIEVAGTHEMGRVHATIGLAPPAAEVRHGHNLNFDEDHPYE